MNRYTTMKTLIVATSLTGLLSAGAALATDGVIEINQAAVDAGGITPGDTPGFPATISEPGSYRLTGNLDVGSVNASAIVINTSNVTLDLGGFEITSTAPTPSINSAGIAGSNTRRNITVRNGKISRMGNAGITLPGARIHVEDVHAVFNSARGIAVGGSSLVRNCNANFNASRGIDVGGGSIVVENTAVENGNSGGAGINAGANSTIRDNIVTGNFDDGLVTGAGSIVTGNTFNNNDNSGAVIGARSLVKGNTAIDNDDIGFDCGSDVGFANNVAALNPGGDVKGAPLEIGTNVCGTGTSC